MNAKTDRLGNPLTADEAELLAIYERLKAFVARPNLAPSTSRNAKKALGAVYCAAADANLVYEHLYDLGV